MTTTLVQSLFIRTEIIQALKADAGLAALIPAARIYPDIVPANVAWPYIKLGVMIDTPIRTDCAVGADVSGAVHVFAKASAAILDPQAFVITINGHVARILEDMDADIHVQLAQEMQDGEEAAARHGFVTFSASAV